MKVGRNASVYAGVLATLLLTAAPAAATPGWSDIAHITKLTQQYSYNGVWVNTDIAVKNDNCSGSPGTYLLPNENHTGVPNNNYKSDYALLMAAYLTGVSLNFYVSGCSDGYPLINAIQLNQQ